MGIFPDLRNFLLKFSPYLALNKFLWSVMRKITPPFLAF